MNITALYAAPLALMLVWLSVNVVKARKAAHVALGDGGHPGLLRAIRAHGNFVEYVPMALVLIGLAEAGHAPAILLHVLGCALLAGRIIHAFGIRQSKENLRLRVISMSLTFAVLAVGAATNVWVALIG